MADKISLTDLVDIVAKSGSPKATKVRQVKDRPDYEPAHDFYRTIREHITGIHQKRLGRDKLDLVLDKLTDNKKIKAYPDVVVGYRKWWGRKSFEWFVPPRGNHGSGKIKVMVNPELGLVFDNKRHVIKLYFKDTPLKSLQTGVITDLLEYVLRSQVGADVLFGVLDVRNSKLFLGVPGKVADITLVNAEIAYIETIWG